MKKIFIIISEIIIFAFIWAWIWIFTNKFLCKINYFQSFSICEISQTWDEKFLEFFMIWWILLTILTFFIIKKLAKF